MLILVTNDDGINALGLHVLEKVASAFGEVVTVAPETEQSGASHAITLLRPLRLAQAGANRFSLDGTPTDCVFIALSHVMDRRPDLVLSGVNRGPNLGYDVLYSGTVAAAMEAALKGIPAISFSLACDMDSMDDTAEHVRRVLKTLVPGIMGRGVALNVNIPGGVDVRGYRAARLGTRIYSGEVISRSDPRGRHYLWIGGSRVTMDNENDTDCGLIQQGYVTITPLGFDLTALESIADIQGKLVDITGDSNETIGNTETSDQDDPGLSQTGDNVP